MDYKGLGRIFKGLAQSGSWGCFDEFNRIILPVLSVCAQQCAVIFGCKKEKKKKFTFTDGETIDMNPEFGVFITMNPTYAGRQELPENLKMQFRNVAMMVPDRQIIIRVKLASCGFLENITLARKFFTLYKLCEEQLTKQVHYDFGLRNILSVLRTLGRAKRENPKDTENTTVMRILKDMNVSKLVDEDEPLFLSLINDLFPNQATEKSGYKDLEAALKDDLSQNGYVYHPSWSIKMIQLYETQRVRHGIMVLGPSGAGKTTCIHTLMRAMTVLGNPHKEFRMNPKAITAAQMFGRLDVATNDWCDGIFSALWRKTLKTNPKKLEHFWLCLDGPVDPIWIENLNSVLDDSKILTLANGDRLNLPSYVKILFEPRDVDNASPATVSRNGMIYMSASGLDWKPKISAWFFKHSMEEKHSKPLLALFQSSFDTIWKYAIENLTFVMKILQVNVFQATLTMLEGLLPCLQPDDEEEEKKLRIPVKSEKKYDDEGNEIPEDEEESHDDPDKNDYEQCYIFSLAWAIGAFLETTERIKLENFLRRSTTLKLPVFDGPDDSIFDYKVNPHTGCWTHWNASLSDYIPPEINPNTFGDILIPNVSSIRTEFILQTCSRLKKNVLLTGEQGSAKTSILNSFLNSLNSEEKIFKKSNFSATTTPQMFQKTIESSVDKRMGSTYGPPIGKTLTVFIDDVNQPEVSEWGDQITNELFRCAIELNGFYSLEKPGEFLTFTDMNYVAAMIHPGGGRNDIPERLKRHFYILNCTLPSEEAIDRIFGVIADSHFNSQRGFSEEVCDLAKHFIEITRVLWKATKDKLLPTPAKFHYVFNLRDLSRIWLGMISTQASVVSSKTVFLQLWNHEVNRIMADRFVSEADKSWFEGTVQSLIAEKFDQEMAETVKTMTYFVDFMRDAPEPTGEEDGDLENELPKVYEPISSFKVVSDRLKFFLEQYNDIMRGSNMDLVFFDDAITHLIKVSRVIRNPGGNIMLIGVGGSGKQSLTKLASFIAGYKTFQISISRSYTTSNFVEDLKLLFRTCGVSGTKTTFLFTDQDIKEESFLEYVNNVLASGLASQIFNKDEQGEIVTELTPIMKRECPRLPPTPDNAIAWFLERVKNNLHVVLCFSPIGETFRQRVLKFPALISGCVIDWFQPWPREALVAVASHFMSSFAVNCSSEGKRSLYRTMASVQDSVAQACVSYFQRFRRATHVTPKSFLNFISSYKDVYSRKDEDIGSMSQRMDSGLQKLFEAADNVAALSKELQVMEKHLEEANQRAELVLKEVTAAAGEAEVVKNKVQEVKNSCEKMVAEIAVEKEIAEEKLEDARPALEEAEEALNTIKPANIATVRKLGRPPHLIMRIMDCVLVLFRKKLNKIECDPTVPSPLPSWNESLKVMSSTTFLSQLVNFPKDIINDEMVEFLEPYLTMEDYNMGTALRVCSDVAGLLCWTKAMAFFFGVNKEVLPLKLNLVLQENRLRSAKRELYNAERTLKKKEKELRKCKEMYVAAVDEKQRLANQADVCRRKMTAASTLINGLTGEKERWTLTSKQLKEQLGRLIGDTLLACGFLSYAGPFNQEYRAQLMGTWKSLLSQKNICFTKDLNVVTMLVDTDEMSEWSLQGLPNDELSLQNASIVTKGRSYPLLVDPQGQGKNWIVSKNQYHELQVTNLNHKYFRTHLEDCLSLGRPLLIEDVGEELDPVLNNLLEGNVIKTGKVAKIMVGDREMELIEGFTLYITTKLPNPAYSPEISARTAIIDFTVTMSGLEDQLLGRVIRMEKSDLETERIRLVEDVIENKATVKELEDNLLEKLTSVEGSLVDDEELISVLQETKHTAEEVNKKLQIASETEKKINAAREEFRPVASRGSILYFLIVEMSKVSPMYQTSLKQFLGLFDGSVTNSKPTHIVQKRIENIIDFLTKSVWKYTSRGLYEQHKFLFTMLLALKIDMQIGKISHQEFLFLLKGGASLNMNSVKVSEIVLHFNFQHNLMIYFVFNSFKKYH
jgi:dynein heavy chain